MKRILALAIGAIAFGTAHAQMTGSGEFKLGLATQDIWRGVLRQDGLTFIPSVDFGFGTGTHVTVRGSLGMAGDGTDEWRYGLHHTLDLIAASLTFGATLYDREGSAGDTSEVWAKATMKWLVPFSFLVVMDIDAVDGMYYRVGFGSGTPNISLFNTSAEVTWDFWLGYADDDFAGYYGSADGGFADAGAKIAANFTVSNASVSVWAKLVTLVDPDFTTFTGDRTNYAIGASAGWRF